MLYEVITIPVFVYAPKHVTPRRIDRLMSQIDVAPTLLGLLNFGYYSKFFGRDVLVITSYSIHYTKLYEFFRVLCLLYDFEAFL